MLPDYDVRTTSRWRRSARPPSRRRCRDPHRRRRRPARRRGLGRSSGAAGSRPSPARPTCLLLAGDLTKSGHAARGPRCSHATSPPSTFRPSPCSATTDYHSDAELEVTRLLRRDRRARSRGKPRSTLDVHGTRVGIAGTKGLRRRLRRRVRQRLRRARDEGVHRAHHELSAQLGRNLQDARLRRTDRAAALFADPGDVAGRAARDLTRSSAATCSPRQSTGSAPISSCTVMPTPAVSAASRPRASGSATWRSR